MPGLDRARVDGLPVTFTPGDAETLATREAVTSRSEMGLTLTEVEGEFHDLRSVAKAFSAFDGLLRAIAKEVAPKERIEPVVVRLDLLDEKLRVTVRLVGAKPRRRKSKP